MNKQKGFTIIELIVVIAIIAVLAAIVLVNVVGYINKSKDAAVKGNMNTMATDAAVFLDTSTNNGVFTGLCTDPASGFGPAWTAAKQYDSSASCGVSTDAGHVGTAWCACVKELAPTTATYYCVDNTGKSSEQTTTDCRATSGAHGCGGTTASNLTCP